MNPIALGMAALGILLFGLGLRLVARQRQVIGWVLSGLGLVALIAPFVITFLLFR